MKETLSIGAKATRKVLVDEGRTIDFMGDDCRVYGTPFLLYDIEMTCRDVLLAHSDPGEDSVGTHVELDHRGATKLGYEVEITATLTALNGRAASFEVTARDPFEEIATAKHDRFVVEMAKVVERLDRKFA